MLRNYTAEQPFTDTTVAGTQYYKYPPGVTGFENAVITIGSVRWPLDPIFSRDKWDALNSMDIQASTYPQFIFARRDDYGIWPIPQDAYTITFNYYIRDKTLSVADYIDGTVAVTSGSATVTGTSTTFTPAMVGRWFTITDPAAYGQGYWYRILTRSSTTSIILNRTYQGSTGSALTYKIGESPELPEEGHILLSDGTSADYFSGANKDLTTATWWNNKFWTGDGNNDRRDLGDDTILAGLIGLYNKYSNRQDERVIRQNPPINGFTSKVWGYTISS